MQQSSAIAGALFIAFIVFITLRGELPAYLNVMLKQGPPSAPPAPSTTPTAPSSSGGSWLDSITGLFGSIPLPGSGSGSGSGDTTVGTSTSTITYQ